MAKIPLVWDGVETGEAEAERQPPYTCLRVRCAARPGLWCAWAVGDAGEARIGVLEPRDGTASIARRFSRQALSGVGRLVRCEVRPAESGGAWERTETPGAGFREDWLRRQLSGVREALIRSGGDRRDLALPARPDEPFPLPGLFCFARLQGIGGRAYWVFSFDGQDRPAL